jgi:hypothetical protein
MMQEGCNRVGCSVASVPMCIGCVSLCYSKRELYICRPQKPSGSNLLDEPLKDFIVIPGYCHTRFLKNKTRLIICVPRKSTHMPE